MSEPNKSEKETGRAPRRIVRLQSTEQSEIVEILCEYAPHEVSGTRLHADLIKFASKHPGQLIAAEWQGPLGWTRFLWKKA